MQTTVTEPVLAIRGDDLFLHVGTAAEVQAHLNDAAADSGIPISPNLEYFDATGLRLQFGSTALEAVPGQVPPTDLDRLILVDRIDLVHAKLQVHLDRAIRDTPAGQQAPPAVRVPRVTGPLLDVLRTLSLLTGPLPSPSQPTPGDFIHKIVYHLTGIPH
jgi:hypothetical protein